MVLIPSLTSSAWGCLLPHTLATMEWHQTFLASPWLNCTSLITSEVRDYFWMVIGHCIPSSVKCLFLSIFLLSCLFHLDFIRTLSILSPPWHLFLNFVICCHRELFHFYAVKFINLSFSFFFLSLCLSIYSYLHTCRGKMPNKCHNTGYF